MLALFAMAMLLLAESGRIPEGNLVSYSALAQSLGLPRSARAA